MTSQTSRERRLRVMEVAPSVATGVQSLTFYRTCLRYHFNVIGSGGGGGGGGAGHSATTDPGICKAPVQQPYRRRRTRAAGLRSGESRRCPTAGRWREVLSWLQLFLLFAVVCQTEGQWSTEQLGGTVSNSVAPVQSVKSVDEWNNAFDADGVTSCQLPEAFHCDERQCLPAVARCNGVTECTNGRDESEWECGCLDNEFFCNGTCIDILDRCNTRTDCDDASDEENCETFACLFSYFKCDNHFCIPGDQVCNFVDDCTDNSDERNCHPRDCWYGEFRCKNKQCIRSAFLCDGEKDCKDGSDEDNCNPEENFVMCGNGLRVHQSFWCDDWPECKDNHADELSCRECTEQEFRCSNSRCVAKAHACDSICDCADTCEDEIGCELRYRRINGIAVCTPNVTLHCQSSERCLSAEYICDGRGDCQNGNPGADEYGCHSQNYTSTTAPEIRCNDGRFLPAKLRCDYQFDCLDGADELDCDFPECNASLEFRCQNGECIDSSLRCDTFTDCKDRSDEMHCGGHSCPDDYFRCNSGQCIPRAWRCDYRPNCPDEEDEKQCGTDYKRNCSADEFRCDNGQCIRRQLECHHKPDSHFGCADGSHLRNCKDRTCPPELFKCRNGYCLDPELVCNGHIDCQGSWSDEDGCPFQCSSEPRCQCQDITIDCDSLTLLEFPADTEAEISRFILSGNYLSAVINKDTFKGMDHISLLNLSNNSLTTLPPLSFQYLHRLKILHLEDNRLSRIYNSTFSGLGSLATINLARNFIRSLDAFAFYGLSSLKVLDLSHQKIVNISQNAFIGLRSLQTLNLSHNKIQYLVDGVLNGMPTLVYLDLSRNSIKIMGGHVFLGSPSMRDLITDEFRFCCLARHVPNCLPTADEFSSCEDLMSNMVLRVCVWVLGLVAFVGNILVIAWRIIFRTSNKVHSFLITNLAFGDMFMGAYLLVIAAVDARYRGVYFIYDSLWRQSGLCQFVGFVSTFSSELSVFTLTIITLDRFISIIFPFRLKRLQMRHTRVAMSVIWLLVCVLAGLPLLRIDYFRHFYGRSGVCLALHITSDKPSGWEYSVFVFLALNFLSFLAIAVSYLWMYAVARNTHRAARSPELKRDNTMAKRMMLIVFTDFCCWMPIIALGVASLSGATIPPQVFAWIAVFILPLNAAINPILYTLSTAPFLGPARKRVSTFRRSFMTSMSGDTHRTIIVSTMDDMPQPAATTIANANVNSLETDDGTVKPTRLEMVEMTEVDGDFIPLHALSHDPNGLPTRNSSRHRSDKVKFDRDNYNSQYS